MTTSSSFVRERKIRATDPSTQCRRMCISKHTRLPLFARANGEARAHVLVPCCLCVRAVGLYHLVPSSQPAKLLTPSLFFLSKRHHRPASVREGALFRSRCPCANAADLAFFFPWTLASPGAVERCVSRLRICLSHIHDKEVLAPRLKRHKLPHAGTIYL